LGRQVAATDRNERVEIILVSRGGDVIEIKRLSTIDDIERQVYSKFGYN
jgi:hypothetical protein